MRINLPRGKSASALKSGDTCRLSFNLKPGILQEGTEKRYRVKAKVARVSPGQDSFAVQYDKPLYEYRRRSRDNFLLMLASLFMLLVTLVILLMRAESVLYFSQNSLLYAYSIVTAAFLLSRYLFGALYRTVPVDPNYTPSITIVIPCFNEETYISRTILSCIDQDYPVDKLQIIIVDDGSSDGSVEAIKRTVEKLWKESSRFKTHERIRVFF